MASVVEKAGVKLDLGENTLSKMHLQRRLGCWGRVMSGVVVIVDRSEVRNLNLSRT
jgi:hypothetical protein